MKALIISKKKKIKAIQKKQKRDGFICRTAAFLLTCIMAAGSVPVYASEAVSQNQSITYVYHEHIGNEETGNGCYSVPVYHVHEGSEEEGGNCYITPVYHVHQGDETNGGPCYGTAVYHVHEGNEGSGGLCFEAVYHKHKASCYEKILGEDDGCTILRYEDTLDGDYEGHDYKNYYMSCGAVVHGTNSSHYHSKMVCRLEGSVTSYVLGCGRTEETIERYEMSCIKTEETIDAYQLSCTKSEQDIEGYELGCGRGKETPVGKLILTGKLTANKKKANLTIVYEDMSEGEVVLSENPYTWYNGSGKLLGMGDKIQVPSNGKYYAVMDVQNEDIKKDSLKAELQVTGIKKEAAETGNSQDGGSGDGQDNTGTENNNIDEPENEVMPTPVASPTVSPMISPAATPVSTREPSIPKKEEVSALPASDNKSSFGEKEAPEDIKTPNPTADWKVEIKERILEEKKSAKEEVPRVETIEMQNTDESVDFFALPAVKMITITAGAFLTLAFLCVFLYLLAHSVRVYNDDGKGNLSYIGRCLVRTQEDGCSITITDTMLRKAVTNRYCIRSEIFHLWKDKEEELLVVRGERRQSVKIQKEIQVVI